MRRYEPIAGITVGLAGSDTTAPIPTNRRLILARVYATGTAAGPVTVYGADVVEDMQFYVGTTLVRLVTAQELLDLWKLNNGAVTPSATVGIPIQFAEPHRASVMDEQVTSWDLFGAPNMTIKARTKAGITNPDVKVILDYDDGFTTNAAGQLFDGLPPVRSIKLSFTQTVAGPVKLLLERRAPVYR